MPARSVPEGFEELHKRLVPSGTESEAAKNHRASIEACLKSNLGLLRFFRSGSFGNGTSIRNYSDVDHFASLPSASLDNDSSKVLRDVAAALRTRFPTTFGIRVDPPAVVVPFGTDASETTEVIPADLVDSNGPFV
jgi:tRNA nucleotidyltransferase (CCA-adding enzyme)